MLGNMSVYSATQKTIDTPPSDAARRVRQYILHKGLKPGDQLPTHDQLAKCLDIGRLRLREGLSILRHQGIIETRNKGGTIVRQPSIRTLSEPISWHMDSIGYTSDDLILARACLESSAAAEAAEKRSARDLLKILDALEQLEARVENPDDLTEEERFHMAIIEATHNPVIVTFGQLIRIQIEGKDLARATRHASGDEQGAPGYL